MQHQMGSGPMGGGPAGGSGQMMQHGDHAAMGQGAHHGDGAGGMPGQMMQHGDQSGMGPGKNQAMMQGDGRCPAVTQQQDGK